MSHLSKKQIAIIKSYLRGVGIAVMPLLAINETRPQAYLYAVLAGVVAPAVRAADKNDTAFGRVADPIADDIDKLVKADKKKSK
jgi:hypothetical protein